MAFRDFIPENEIDGEPFGDGGFQDFVPPKKPVEKVVSEAEAPAPVGGVELPTPAKKGKK